MTLECKNITFAYGKNSPLISGADLSLQKGLTVLCGPNGCGKSTLLRLLSGERIPQNGSVLLDGNPIRSYPGNERAKRISVVLQNMAPALDFTVEEFVAMGRSAYLPIWGPPGEKDLRLIRESMECFEVAHLRKRSCNTLSGGELQRTALAAAWANDPEILLLDEPTSATDVAHTELIKQRLKECAAEKTIFMICHDLMLCANMADQVILMRNGRFSAQGKPEEVFTEEKLEEVFDTPFRIMTLPSGERVILPGKHFSGGK